MAGLGLLYEPDFLLADAIRRGQLVRILPEYTGATGDIWAVYPSRRHLSLKVRLFVEHVAQVFATFDARAGAASSAPQQ
jgi:DNA-binding transcriptional LysR family regulator